MRGVHKSLSYGRVQSAIQTDGTCRPAGALGYGAIGML